MNKDNTVLNNDAHIFNVKCDNCHKLPQSPNDYIIIAYGKKFDSHEAFWEYILVERRGDTEQYPDPVRYFCNEYCYQLYKLKE